MRSKRLGERNFSSISLPPSSPNGESTSLIRGRLAAAAGLGIANMMFETFNTSSSTQGYLYSSSANIPNGASIVITDADGNEILRTTTQHSTKVFIISCPEMVKGKTYTMIINGSSYKATAQ